MSWHWPRWFLYDTSAKYLISYEHPSPRLLPNTKNGFLNEEDCGATPNKRIWTCHRASEWLLCSSTSESINSMFNSARFLPWMEALEKIVHVLLTRICTCQTRYQQLEREWSLVQWLQVLILSGEDVGSNPAGKLFTPQKLSIHIPNPSLPSSLRRR